jgi:undecaprenyl-diphosphatase
VLGILQGLTEFLPISSSAHLILLPWLLGWEPMGLTFDVVLHGGTTLAVLIYFHKEWKELSQQWFKQWTQASRGESTLLGALIVGTIPAGLVGWLAQGFIESYLRGPLLIGMTLCAFGLLLGWSDSTARQTRSLSSITMKEGLLIGLAQALALVPGVSRAGVTISVALMLGFSRADSARFSFLLGTPLLMGATFNSLYLLWKSQINDLSTVLPLLIGVIFSFVSAFLCIRYLLQFLQSHTYFPFVIYRLLLAALVFVWLLL